jgi:hypothetical protein
MGVFGAALMIALAACRPALPQQALAAAPATPALQQSGEVVWGRVPYCNCLGDSATANVANALKDANLATSLKEVSPRDGWLYFVVSFDSQVALRDQVSTAIEAGGGEVLDGPP